jgi:hypothetical protein
LHRSWIKFAATGFAVSGWQSRGEEKAKEEFDYLYPNPTEKDEECKNYAQQEDKKKDVHELRTST